MKILQNPRNRELIHYMAWVAGLMLAGVRDQWLLTVGAALGVSIVRLFVLTLRWINATHNEEGAKAQFNVRELATLPILPLVLVFILIRLGVNAELLWTVFLAAVGLWVIYLLLGPVLRQAIQAVARSGSRE